MGTVGLRGKIAFTIALLLVATGISSIGEHSARADHVANVTLSGPARPVAGVEETYGGTVRLAAALGIPGVPVEIVSGDAVLAAAVTGPDGAYSAPVTFTELGATPIIAIALRGTPLEERSAALSVTVVQPITVTGLVEFDTGGPLVGAAVRASFGVLGPEGDDDGVTADDGRFTLSLASPQMPIEVLVEVRVARAQLPTADQARIEQATSSALDVGRILIPEAEGAELPIVGSNARSADNSVSFENLPPEIDRIFARTYDPDAQTDVFPGEFAESGFIPLNSSSFTWVEALDAAGNPVSELAQAVTMRSRVAQSQWGDLEDIEPGTGRIDLPIYIYNEDADTWDQVEDGWIEDGSGAVLPEEVETEIMAGTYGGTVYAVYRTDHFSFMNVDYAYIGPWTLSELDREQRNTDCLYLAVQLAHTIIKTNWANEAFKPVNKPGKVLSEELQDGLGPELKGATSADLDPDGERTFGENFPTKVRQKDPNDWKKRFYLNNALWNKCDTKKKETIFTMAVTILHETAHWKNSNLRLGARGAQATPEDGLTIEQSLFGGKTIWTDDPDGKVNIVEKIVAKDGTDTTDITGDKLDNLTDPNWWSTNDANFNAAFWNTFWSGGGGGGGGSGGAPEPAEPATSPLKLTLALDASEVDLGASLPVRVTYENVGDAPIDVLGLTVLEGYPLAFRITDTSGKPVTFVGSQKKMGYADDDFVNLAPGGTLERTLNLTQSADGAPLYNFTHGDVYSAVAVYGGFFGLPETESSPVAFTVRKGGKITGAVRNATNSASIPGATVRAFKGGIEVAQATTDAFGNYTTSELAPGTYTLEARAAGFLKHSRTGVVVTSQATIVENFNLSPLLAAGVVRLVLTWSANPRDLDSHSWTPASKPYHVFYARPGATHVCPFVTLDQDVTGGFGPETTTIDRRFLGTYTYAVHNWSERGSPGSTGLSNSGAQVDVYDSTGLIATITPPPGTAGVWWKVLEIDGDTGALDEINSIGGDPSPYGDTASGCV